MNEFELIIDDAYKAGLRRYEKSPVNFEALVECFNAKPGEVGLEPYEPFTALPIETPDDYDGVDQPWPFPQLISSERYAFIVYRDTGDQKETMYLINSDWSLTQIAEFTILDYGSFGGYWEIADFGTFVLLMNGVAMVYYDTLTSAWKYGSISNDDPYSEVPVAKTLCNFRGQVVAGNFTDMPAGDWWGGFGTEFVGWSRIGEVSFNQDLRNEAGYRPTLQGDVVRVVPMRDLVVVYSEKGVGVIEPVTAPAATFGYIEILPINVSAAGGGLDRQILIDDAGNMWSFSSGKKIEELGYKEFMSQLTDPIVVHHPDREEIYISDDEKCYVLTRYGLGECHQLVKSIGKVNGSIYATFDDTEDVEYRTKTHHFDMGLRGQKTTFVLEHGLVSEYLSMADVEWRHNISTDFSSSGLKPLNFQGVSSNRIAGVEFRVLTKSANYLGVQQGYTKVRWKMTDLRSLRGVYRP